MRYADNIRKLFEKLHTPTSTKLDEKIYEEISTALVGTNANKPAQPILWRIIMISKITKIAAAAVIIIAVTLGALNIGGGSVTWAQVIEPILNARTASLDIIIGSQVIHDEVMGSTIRRTVSNAKGTDIIIDFQQKKILTLDSGTKIAVFIDFKGLGNVQNFVEMLQNTILRIQRVPDFKIDDLGLKEMNGQNYHVFVAKAANETITIWADPKTARPVHIEQKTPNMQIVCDNVQFDIALDESQFSMEIPAGYTVQSSGIDFGSNSEADFIETLRIWAEIIEDGHFPDGISLEDVVNIGQKFNEGLKRANLTQQEQLEVVTKWGQGYVFIRLFKGQGQWHYVGKGVKFGDADIPIFWYQPQNSATWRVIYGDLTVKDVTLGNLPN
jgi:hypothetical protein